MRSKRGIIGGSLAATIIVAGAWLHAAALRSRTQRIALIEEEIASLRATDIDQLQGNVDQLRMHLRRRQRTIPAVAQVSTLLEKLAVDMSELELRDRSFSTSAPVQRDNATHIPLTLSCRGSFAGVFALFERMAAYERLTHLRHLAITREPGAARDDLQVSIELFAFAMPDGEVTP